MRCLWGLDTTTPRDVIDNKTYHIFCGGKSEETLLKRIKKMKIRYLKNEKVTLTFQKNEIQVALSLLKALYKNKEPEFVGRAIKDIEADLQLSTKKLSFVNHFHICEYCFREIDDRDSNSFKMTTRNITGEEVVKWIHYKCKPLKPDSTRER